MGPLVGGNARPVIGNRNDRSLLALRNFDKDLTGLAAVLERIIDKIGDGIEQEIPIASDEYLLVPGAAEPAAIFLRRGVEQLNDLVCNLGQIHCAERVPSIARLDLRYPGNRGKH